MNFVKIIFVIYHNFTFITLVNAIPLYIFYVLGMYVKKTKIVFSKLSKKICWSIFSITFLLELIESFFYINYNFGFAVGQNRPLGFLYAITVIILIVKYQDIKYENKLLIYVGDKSYAIFFMHCFFLMFLATATQSIDILPLRTLICTCVSIVLSIVSSKIINIVFKNKSNIIFGF